MLVCGKDIVQRGSDFKKRAEALSLRAWQWEFLLALDGHTSLADIANRIEIDMATATESILGFCDQGLVVIRSMNLEEYLRAPLSVGTHPPPRVEAESITEDLPIVRVQEAISPIAFSLKAPLPNANGNRPKESLSGLGTIGFKIKYNEPS